MTLRLPQEKITELRSLLEEWQTKKVCLTKDLQSLVGKLQHACKVVCPGRTFLRRMFDLLKGVPRRQRFIRLNTAFGMVGRIYGGVERHLHGAQPGRPPRCSPVLRRVRRVPLRGMVRSGMVSIPMAGLFCLKVHSGKRTPPNCHGMLCMGHGMEATTRPGTLQQPSSGGGH